MLDAPFYPKTKIIMFYVILSTRGWLRPFRTSDFLQIHPTTRHLLHSWSDSDALSIELVVIYFFFSLVPFDFILLCSLFTQFRFRYSSRANYDYRYVRTGSYGEVSVNQQTPTVKEETWNRRKTLNNGNRCFKENALKP